jgi:hypothetical protein
LKEKSLYYFHKKFKILKTQKTHKKKTFLVGFLGGFFWVGFLGGFFNACREGGSVPSPWLWLD